MRKLLIFIAVKLVCLTGFAQNPAVVDSFKRELPKATSPDKKIEILGYLTRVFTNINLTEADKYGQQMIEEAELSRDRRLMIKAFMANGERFSYLAGRRDNIEKSIDYYSKALELARKNKLDTQIVSAYLALSEVHRYIPNPEKALSFCSQAYSYAGVMKNDSLVARVNLEYGAVYVIRNEKLLALRHYLSGLRLSEEMNDPGLLRASYTKLAGFYGNLEDYDKAIDYQVKAIDMIGNIKNSNSAYVKVQDLSRAGDLYSAKRNPEMAMLYYEKSLALSDSLKYEPLKVLAYRSIVNNYLTNDQPAKALAYFNEHPQLKDFLMRMNFNHFVDQSYGFIYAQLGMYDSAKYYYLKIAPFFEKSVNNSNRYSYCYQLGMVYRKTGEYKAALECLNTALAVAKEVGSLQQMSDVTELLDTVYRLSGDYAQALQYTTLRNQYKDSLDKLGKEKDLMQIEVDDEQQRQARLEKEAQLRKQRRQQAQILGITIGIAALFIFLVMLGMLNMSVNAIKIIGFFTFLMVFEFIFLLFKKNIYGLTQGEPLKDLGFMILLAAFLVPLHHWLEHKVIHYLTTHNRFRSSGRNIVTKLFKRQSKDTKAKSES